MDYLLDGTFVMRNGKIDKYLFEGGYAQATTGAYTDSFAFYYYSKDHLGNVRSVVTKNPTTNEISEVQQTHYYHFGGVIADISTGTSAQNKLYNGKELDASNNLWWYDYGARQYDPTAPRFTTPDPLVEKYYGWNMYGYCRDNPVKHIDPDGRAYDNLQVVLDFINILDKHEIIHYIYIFSYVTFFM